MRKIIDPVLHESWTRGRALYREKCEQSLVVILKEFNPLITSSRIQGLPWAGSAPRNPKVIVMLMAMLDRNTCCGVAGLSSNGMVVDLTNEGFGKFEEFVDLHSEKIWAIMTRKF